MEIAVFGGTFDPPTVAHEAIIDACLQREDIDQVWIMPSGLRGDKQWMTHDMQRLMLLGLMKQTRFHDDSRLRITDIEMHSSQPTETWRTSQTLQQLYPRDHFWWVFGADSYLDMPNWYQGDKLQKETNLLLIPREGYELPEPCDRIGHLAVSVCALGVSSTRVREVVAKNERLDNLVSPGVAAFITQHGLYQYATM